MIALNSSESEKWLYFDYCLKNHIPIRGTITAFNDRNGLTVNVYGISAHLDKREMSYNYIPNFEDFVGKSFLFEIIFISRYLNKLVVSRKRVVNTYKQYDVVDGIVTQVLQNRLDIDCGRKVCIRIRNLSDRYVRDISELYQIGQQVRCMLIDEHGYEATMKTSTIWEKKAVNIEKNDLLTVQFIEQKDHGIVVHYQGLRLYIDYDFLTPEYQALFDNHSIPLYDNLTAAVTKVDVAAKKIYLSMKLADKIAKKEAKEQARLKRESAIAELRSQLKPGLVVEAIVKEVSRKGAIINISGTDVDCFISREELSPNQAISAEDEVFVGERISVVYIGEEKGELIFNRKLIMNDIYDSSLYDLPIIELLDRMDIHSKRFVGKTIKRGNDMFFTNVITRDDNPLENGKLLVDPQIGRSIFVHIPSSEVLEENVYYEFDLKLGAKSLRQKKGSPYMFSIGGAFKRCEDPYLDLVALSFKQHTSPNTNTSVANLLEEVGQNLYTSKKRMFFELLQNADDAAPLEGVKVKIQIIGQYFVITHDGYAFNQHDFESITSAAKSTKSSNSKKTGYKGIGFKSVFTNSQSVFIKSLGFKFGFDKFLDTYNDFESFYFLVNDIEDNLEEQEKFLRKYGKYYREFRGVKDIPWQLLPIWKDDLTIEPDSSIFNRDENVAIALKMDENTLTEYNEAVREVFSQPRFMLFLRRTNRVQLLIDGKTLTIQKNKDDKTGTITLVNSFSEEDKLSENYRIITIDDIFVNDSAFQDAGVLMKREERINNRGEKENYYVRIDSEGKSHEISGIPDRLTSATETSISFAVLLDYDNHVSPSETGESSLYAYLPMNEHRFKFPFYINADFIPKSDREGIQSDNPWNHFLFYTIGKNIVMMVAKLASINEPKYLDLLLSNEFVSNSQDTAALIDSFNLGYMTTLHQIPFIINDEGTAAKTSDIILDLSGLSSEISPKSFYTLLGTDKHLPHNALDSDILSKDIFKIQKFTTKAVVDSLASNIDGLNNWIKQTSKEEREKFFSWIATTDEASPLIPKIKLFTFGGDWKSLDEIQGNKSYVVLSETTNPIKDVLVEMGFICSDDIIENHLLADLITQSDDKDLFDEINNRNVQSLNFEHRLLLFQQTSRFKGIGPSTLQSWKIFRNQDNCFMPLSLLCAYSENLPSWLSKYTLKQNEYRDDLSEHLIPNDKNTIYTSIVVPNIDELLSIVGISKIYSEFSGFWSSQLTTKLFGRVPNEELVSVVEQSDDFTKEAFVKTLQELPLYSTRAYADDLFEYRVIRLAIGSATSVEHIRRIATIDGMNLSEYTVKDELTLSYGDRKLTFLLSKILPSYTTSSVLSSVSREFSTIVGHDKVFEQREADPSDIRNKLYYELSGSSKLTTAYQYCFLMVYRRSKGYSVFDNLLKSCIRINDEQTFIQLLDLALEMKLGDVLKSFISNGGVAYPFNKLVDTYFNSDEYTLVEEQTPSFVKNWANNDDKKHFLIELGLHDDQSKEIIRRKSFKEKKLENIWNITDISIIRPFLKWVISSFELPIINANQVNILKSLCSCIKSYPRPSESFDETDIKAPTEWANPRYQQWQSSSALRIFIVDGLLPYRCVYDGVYLYQEDRDVFQYFDSSKRLYISNSKEPASILTDAYADKSNPFTQSDWNKIFLISAEESDKRIAELNERNRELERRLKEYERDNSARLTKGEDSALSRSEKYDAQLEAQNFLMEQMPHWEFPDGYGKRGPNDVPYHFSTTSVKDENGKSLYIVLKSYKKQSEPFKINPEEWDYMMKKEAHLFIYDGRHILEIEPKDLILNQSNITITFSTENLDIEQRINAFAEALHYFKELHFDFESFNVSKKAKSIQEIFNKTTGNQPQFKDDEAL